MRRVAGVLGLALLMQPGFAEGYEASFVQLDALVVELGSDS